VITSHITVSNTNTDSKRVLVTLLPRSLNWCSTLQSDLKVRRLPLTQGSWHKEILGGQLQLSLGLRLPRKGAHWLLWWTFMRRKVRGAEESDLFWSYNLRGAAVMGRGQWAIFPVLSGELPKHGRVRKCWIRILEWAPTELLMVPPPAPPAVSPSHGRASPCFGLLRSTPLELSLISLPYLTPPPSSDSILADLGSGICACPAFPSVHARAL
jgi:hypothetical protein